jgi:hypothetical protein
LVPLLATEVTVAFLLAAVDEMEEVMFRAVELDAREVLELEAAEAIGFADWPGNLVDAVGVWEMHSSRDFKGL